MEVNQEEDDHEDQEIHQKSAQKAEEAEEEEGKGKRSSRRRQEGDEAEEAEEGGGWRSCSGGPGSPFGAKCIQNHCKNHAFCKSRPSRLHETTAKCIP